MCGPSDRSTQVADQLLGRARLRKHSTVEGKIPDPPCCYLSCRRRSGRPDARRTVASTVLCPLDELLAVYID